MSLQHDIKAYLDGELEGDKALQVAQMLQSDESLRKEADDYRALSSTLRLVKEPELVVTGFGATLKALENKKEPAKARPWWMGGWGFALAGAGAVILAAIYFPAFAQSKSGEAKIMASTPSGDAMGVSPGDIQMPQRDRMKSAKSASALEPAAPMESAPMAESFAKADSAAGGTTSPSIHVDSRTANNAGRSVEPKDLKFTAGDPYAGDRNTKQAVRAPQATKSRTLQPNPSAKPMAPHLVIQNGNVNLWVKDVAAAQSQVENIGKSMGGYVSTSNLVDNGGPDNKQATVQIRVPVTRFQDALNAVRMLGEVSQQSVGGSDVTAQVADAEGRMKSLRAEADQLRELVRRARDVNEVLTVRDRLTQVQQEIDGLDAQRSAMRDQASMSTLTVNMSRKPKPMVPQPVGPVVEPTWLEKTLGDAGETFANILQMIVGLLVQLLALSPIWVPVLALSYWAWKVSESKRPY